MERGNRRLETRYADHREVDPERKWRWLQYLGLLLLLAIPTTIAFIATFKGWIVRGDSALTIIQIVPILILFLAMAGVVCFKVGYDKRVELRDKQDSQL